MKVCNFYLFEYHFIVIKPYCYNFPLADCYGSDVTQDLSSTLFGKQDAQAHSSTSSDITMEQASALSHHVENQGQYARLMLGLLV